MPAHDPMTVRSLTITHMTMYWLTYFDDCLSRDTDFTSTVLGPVLSLLAIFTDDAGSASGSFPFLETEPIRQSCTLA